MVETGSIVQSQVGELLWKTLYVGELLWKTTVLKGHRKGQINRFTNPIQNEWFWTSLDFQKTIAQGVFRLHQDWSKLPSDYSIYKYQSGPRRYVIWLPYTKPPDEQIYQIISPISVTEFKFSWSFFQRHWVTLNEPSKVAMGTEEMYSFWSEMSQTV